MNLRSDEPKNKLMVYVRQSQKRSAGEDKQPQEIKEANLFVYLRKLGFQESLIVLF